MHSLVSRRPHLTTLQPDTGNLTPGLHLAPGYHHALVYSDPTGRLHTSSVPEVTQWVCTLPPPEPIPPVPVPSAGVLSATRTTSRPIPSAPSAGVPSARKDDTPSNEFISDGNFFEDFFACDPFFAPAYTGALSALAHALSALGDGCPPSLLRPVMYDA